MYTHSRCAYAEENESLSTRPEGRRERKETERRRWDAEGALRMARKGRSEIKEREREEGGWREKKRKEAEGKQKRWEI